MIAVVKVSTKDVRNRSGEGLWYIYMGADTIVEEGTGRVDGAIETVRCKTAVQDPRGGPKRSGLVSDVY